MKLLIVIAVACAILGGCAGPTLNSEEINNINFLSTTLYR